MMFKKICRSFEALFYSINTRLMKKFLNNFCTGSFPLVLRFWGLNEQVKGPNYWFKVGIKKSATLAFVLMNFSRQNFRVTVIILVWGIWLALVSKVFKFNFIAAIIKILFLKCLFNLVLNIIRCFLQICLSPSS